MASIALASSVTLEPTLSIASISGPMRNICGVCASHLSLRSTVEATRTPPGPSMEVLSVSASLCASSPPTLSPAHWSMSASICSEVTRQRAASCTSTQSPGCAPRSSSALRPPSTVSARVGPPHSTTKNAGWAWASRKRSPGATATSVPSRRPTPAKAASVCSTIGWPATRWYCLGSGAVGALADSAAAGENAATVDACTGCACAAKPAPAGTARDPTPAQGTSAQKRPWADKGVSEGCSRGAVMERSF